MSGSVEILIFVFTCLTAILEMQVIFSKNDALLFIFYCMLHYKSFGYG